jgi:ATP/maltotriose-dependent transcriptional regulator MalT
VEHPVPKSCAWSDIHRYGALAHALLASSQGRAQDAVSILTTLKRDADDAHNDYFGLRVGTHLAVAYLRAGDHAGALLAFREALVSGSLAGLHQAILDQGPELGSLLPGIREDAARTGSPASFVSYVDRLVEGYAARYQREAAERPTAAIADPLSGREGHILNLIAQGQSDKEIARILSIAPETVKSHVKHIFTKLNVQKRAQAVSRAQNLGLV